MKQFEKFSIKLNYMGENHEFFRYAPTPQRAKKLGVIALERELNRAFGSLTFYFTDRHYEVKEVK
jgi:hypothetical protein